MPAVFVLREWISHSYSKQNKTKQNDVKEEYTSGGMQQSQSKTPKSLIDIFLSLLTSNRKAISNILCQDHARVRKKCLYH